MQSGDSCVRHLAKSHSTAASAPESGKISSGKCDPGGWMDNRLKDGGYYDGYWDEYYETSSSDDLMNDHTKQLSLIHIFADVFEVSTN